MKRNQHLWTAGVCCEVLKKLNNGPDCKLKETMGRERRTHYYVTLSKQEEGKESRPKEVKELFTF